jgi:hypothetical protein
MEEMMRILVYNGNRELNPFNMVGRISKIATVDAIRM